MFLQYNNSTTLKLKSLTGCCWTLLIFNLGYSWNLISWISVSVKVLGGLSFSFEIAELLTGQILDPVKAHMMMLGLWNAIYVSCKFKAKFFLSLGFPGFSLVFFAVLYHSFFREPNTLLSSGCIKWVAFGTSLYILIPLRPAFVNMSTLIMWTYTVNLKYNWSVYECRKGIWIHPLDWFVINN